MELCHIYIYTYLCIGVNYYFFVERVGNMLFPLDENCFPFTILTIIQPQFLFLLS